MCVGYVGRCRATSGLRCWRELHTSHGARARTEIAHAAILTCTRCVHNKIRFTVGARVGVDTLRRALARGITRQDEASNARQQRERR